MFERRLWEIDSNKSDDISDALSWFYGDSFERTAKKVEKLFDDSCTIKSITLNEDKKITTVVFGDGSVKMSKCNKKDSYDPSIGVAMCIAYKIFDSKTKFHKYVNDNGKKIKTTQK